MKQNRHDTLLHTHLFGCATKLESLKISQASSVQIIVDSYNRSPVNMKPCFMSAKLTVMFTCMTATQRGGVKLYIYNRLMG